MSLTLAAVSPSVRAGRDPAADDVRSARLGVQLDVDDELGRDRPVRHPQGDGSRDLAGGREVADRRSGRPGGVPECEPAGRLGRQERAEGLGRVELLGALEPQPRVSPDDDGGVRRVLAGPRDGQLERGDLCPFRPADVGRQGVPGRDLNLGRRQHGGLLLVAGVPGERALPAPEDVTQHVAPGASVGLGQLARRRQRPPLLDDHGEGEGRVRSAEDVPDVLAEPDAQTLTPGELRQRRRAEAEPVAEAIPPGHEHGPGIAVQPERLGALPGGRAEAVLPVDRLDPRDRGQLAPGLARVREELQRPGPDHGVVGDDLGRPEVPLEGRVLHELGVADVGEPLAGDGVADEVVGDLQVEPGQVPDRVGVLGARQPPDRDRSGVALVFLDESSEPGVDGLDDRLPLRVARLRHVLRRHLPLADHADDLFPVLEAATEIRGARSSPRGRSSPRPGRRRDSRCNTPGGAVAGPDRARQPPREGGRDGEHSEDESQSPTATPLCPPPRHDSHATHLS